MRPGPRSAAGRRVEAILRTLGKPEPELLEALLDGINLKQLAERARNVAVADLLEAAFTIHAQVYEFLQTCTREQRAHLRTCSHQLIAIGMDRACHLETMQRRELERERERQDAQRRVEQLTSTAQALVRQAAEMLAKVRGEGAPDLIEPAEPGTDPPIVLARALVTLAESAQALTEHPSTKVQLRMVLYGLDRAYVESMFNVAAELERFHRASPAGHATNLPLKEFDHARAVTLFMVEHFVRAFDAARRVDKAIPVLDAKRIAAAAKLPPDSVSKLLRGLATPLPAGAGPRKLLAYALAQSGAALVSLPAPADALTAKPSPASSRAG